VQEDTADKIKEGIVVNEILVQLATVLMASPVATLGS
jgi:hypothetical protein